MPKVQLRMQEQTLLINSLEQLKGILSECGDTLVLDLETNGLHWWRVGFRVVGISVSGLLPNNLKAFYIPLQEFNMDEGVLESLDDDNLLQYIGKFLVENKTKCIFHNAFFDLGVLHELGIKPTLHMDTMLLWYLLDNRSPKSYGLKNAQITQLGWEAKGDIELKAHVTERIKQLGIETDEWGAYMYLADTAVLARYAMLDATSTWDLYNKWYPEFVKQDYRWFFEDWVVPYMRLLQRQYIRGISMSGSALSKAMGIYKDKIVSLKDEFLSVVSTEIKELEKDMLDEFVNDPKIKTESGRARRLADTHRHPKFNINSCPMKGRLIKNKMGLPLYAKTKTGKIKVNAECLGYIEDQHEGISSLLNYSLALKRNQYLDQYAKYTDRFGLLHGNFKQTGTVSGRLTGSKPNLQQIPKDDKDILKCFVARPGHRFIYYDFNSVEPMITAHFSGDETYKKVIAGKGDIYLESIEVLFPEKAHLYDPNDIKASKERLKEERKKCKVFQLALSYGGTEFAVCRNMGWHTSDSMKLAESKRMLRSYWKKFRKIKQLESRLKLIYKEKGYITNGFGRKLFLDKNKIKDILNRFIQSTGHDCLIYLNLQIEKLSKDNYDILEPLQVDEHDAGIWEVRDEHVQGGLNIVKKALERVNEFSQFSINLKIEPKVGGSFADFV